MKVRSRRIGPGRYEVDTNHGTYHVDNCPADNPRETGLPAGPRWMVTAPGRYFADSEEPTKRDALAYIRTLHDEHEAAPTEASAPEPGTSNEDTGPSLDDYAKASRIIQSLIPGVRR